MEADLDWQYLVEKFEIETGHFTSEASKSTQFPTDLPVIVGRKQFTASGYELPGLLIGHLFHSQTILCQNSGPLTYGHSFNIKGGLFMYFPYSSEKSFRVVWEEARVW